ncbi:MAG: hypothetical protein ACFCUI_03745 [Bernardetiaceae bacterium]
MYNERDDNYEFNDQENGILKALSSRMYWVAVVFLILGGLKVFEGMQSLLLGLEMTDTLMRDMIQDFLLSGMFIIMGILTLSVSQSFKLVINTEGRDIDNLLDAVKALTKLQTVTLILIAMTIISTLVVWIPFLLRRFS